MTIEMMAVWINLFGIFTFLVIAVDEMRQGKLLGAAISVILASFFCMNLLALLDVI